MDLINRMLAAPTFVGLLAITLIEIFVAAGGGAYARNVLDHWQGWRSLRALVWNGLLTVGICAAILIAAWRVVTPAYAPLVIALALAAALAVLLLPGLGAVLYGTFSGNVVVGGLFAVLGLAMLGKNVATGASLSQWAQGAGLLVLGALILRDALGRMARGQ